MRALDSNFCLSGLLLLLAISGGVGLPASTAYGQTDQRTPSLLRTFEPPAPSNRVRKTLAQFDAMLAAEPVEPESLADALELIESLLADPTVSDTYAEASVGRLVPLAERCHQRLASLPPDALRRYREQVDPRARKLFQRGVQHRDEKALRRIVREMFCSSWGDDALAVLGEIALQRGDHAAARRCLRRISPLLSAPEGTPLAWALRGVDLGQHGQAVTKRLLSAKPSSAFLLYPDSDLSTGEMLARLVVVSLRQGSLERAECELQVLERLDPDSTGWLAGREVSLGPELRKLLQRAHDKTVAEDQDGQGVANRVGPLTGRVWPAPRAFTPQNAWRVQPNRLRGIRLLVDAVPKAIPPIEPAVHNRAVLVREGSQLKAFDLLSGEAAITRSGVLYAPQANSAPVPAQRNRLLSQPRLAIGSSLLAEAVTVAGDSVYARVAANGRTPNGGTRVVGIDLEREGLVTLDLAPPENEWAFAGPPEVIGQRLYVALLASDIRPRVAIACYSAVTGRPIWQTELGSGPPAAGFGAAASMMPPLRLTLSGDTLYTSTNVGAIAALARADGAIRWITTYATQESNPPAWSPPSTGCGCFLREEILYTSPSDTKQLLALDTATGQALWSRPLPTPDSALLGIVGDTIIVGGPQLTGLSAVDGTRRYQWPDTLKSGIRGMGRGCVAGEEVFWPTRDRLFVLNPQTGRQTRDSIDIADLGGAGVNVVRAGSGLVIAGAKSMTVLGPVNRQQDNQPQLSLRRGRTTLSAYSPVSKLQSSRKDSAFLFSPR